jgi:hypothetical protein
MDESGAHDLSELPSDERQRYLTACRQMTKLALDHAIPIIFAPPIGKFAIPLNEGKFGTVTLPMTLGKIESATGCVLQLQAAYFVVTAEHVLEAYEKRINEGEVLNWQVGDFRFDPLPRVAWRGSSKNRPKDIVFLRVSEQEAKEACADRTHILSAPTGWPPRAPQEGEMVLLAGYPTQLREVDGGVIRPGPLSAMLPVSTSTGDGTFKCRYEYADLISFDSHALPLEGLSGNLGGVSGGPVFSMGTICYPFVGVISQRSGAFDDFDTFVIEAVEGVPSSFPT